MHGSLKIVFGSSKADLVKKLHKQVKERIEKQNAKVTERVNKGRTPMVFQAEINLVKPNTINVSNQHTIVVKIKL